MSYRIGYSLFERRIYGFEIPGIDILCDSRELSTAKQAQSAVHQYGREAMLSELYGVTNWDFDMIEDHFARVNTAITRGTPLVSPYCLALGNVEAGTHDLRIEPLLPQARQRIAISILWFMGARISGKMEDAGFLCYNM